ncbi:hypothetical protein JKP88DRAFT_252818 [Tribonema minus]|uniref:Uncharacterized protein n=1 Tax=Tribonema minus TaxID=303371 RepID=A0A836CL95_9STRA|nr:hypothetical protein JKP88DRAFT_252818 [Tribonema minus]
MQQQHEMAVAESDNRQCEETLQTKGIVAAGQFKAKLGHAGRRLQVSRLCGSNAEFVLKRSRDVNAATKCSLVRVARKDIPSHHCRFNCQLWPDSGSSSGLRISGASVACLCGRTRDIPQRLQELRKPSGLGEARIRSKYAVWRASQHFLARPHLPYIPHVHLSAAPTCALLHTEYVCCGHPCPADDAVLGVHYTASVVSCWCVNISMASPVETTTSDANSSRPDGDDGPTVLNNSSEPHAALTALSRCMVNPTCLSNNGDGGIQHAAAGSGHDMATDDHGSGTALTAATEPTIAGAPPSTLIAKAPSARSSGARYCSRQCSCVGCSNIWWTAPASFIPS